MRINQEKLAALAALPDDRLWQEILAIAKAHGIELPKNPPSHEQMEKMRQAASGGAKINLAEAVRVINEYKKGAKK